MKYKKAFSILELAMSLTVIALLAAVVTYGSGLVTTSKYQKIIDDIQTFTQATNIFYEKYNNSLPGDISTVSALPSGASGTAGNGNGVIEADEAKYYWLHLSLAQLIPGYFTSSAGPYTTTASTGAAALPAGPLDGSGYTILNGTPQLFVQFAIIDANEFSTSMPILSPREMYGIDKKYDDGVPTTGSIRASEGQWTTSLSCVKMDQTYVNRTAPTCIARFVIRQSQKAVLTDASTAALTCTGGYHLGALQQSSTACPAGTYGKVYRMCKQTGAAAASWVDTIYNCEPIRCAYDVEYSKTRNFPCPEGYYGSVQATCGVYGIFSNFTSNCTVETANSGCNIAHSSINLACPIGQSGVRVLYCDKTDLVWKEDATSSTCTTISNVGVNNNTTTACPGTYSASNLFAGSLNYTTTLTPSAGDDTNNATYNNTALRPGKVTTNSCRYRYDHSCVAGTTYTVSCPVGEAGTHTMHCVSSGNSYTIGNTCKPVTCDGFPLGSFKKAEGLSCSEDQAGNVYYVCMLIAADKATWQLVDTATTCATKRCPRIPSGDDGFNYSPVWNSGPYLAGNSYLPSSCGSGRTPTNARYCDKTGNWGASVNGGQFCT